VLRKQPRYLASMVKFLTFAEMEPLVQTITFSLFSDLYLAREEYLMLSLIDVRSLLFILYLPID
jgi:Ras GTPase-activating-like protein IQGAP2/3